MNIKTIQWMVIGVLCGLLVFSLLKYSKVKKALTQEQLDRQHSDSLVNALGQIVYTQEVLRTNDKESFKRMTDSLFDLTRRQQKQIKDVIAFYKGIINFEVRDVKVPYLDTSAMIRWSDSVERRCSDVIAYYEANMMPVPRTAEISTKNYSISVTARQDSMVINNIQIPDSQYIRFVTKKGGLLKRDTDGKLHFFLGKKIEVQVLHSNDSIHVTGQNSVIYSPPKKAHVLGKALLMGAGVLIGLQL